MKALCLICSDYQETENWVQVLSGDKFGVCPSCLADAKLGRMVRNIEEGTGFFLNRNRNGEKRWAAGFGPIPEKYGPYWGSTPEEALEKAGVRS